MGAITISASRGQVSLQTSKVREEKSPGSLEIAVKYSNIMWTESPLRKDWKDCTYLVTYGNGKPRYQSGFVTRDR